MEDVQELQRLVHAERAQHERDMNTLEQESASLRLILEEEQQHFTELITRVTELRVAKGERMADKLNSGVMKEHFHTGCEAVDDILLVLRGRLESTLAFGSSLVSKLAAAAEEAVTPLVVGKLAVLASNGKATRTTSVAIVTRNDIRSVRSWACKHIKDCPKCSIRASRVPPWEPYRLDDKRSGLAAVPFPRDVPGKQSLSFSARIFRERSVSERSEDRTLDVLRVSTTVAIHRSSTAGGGPVAEPDAAAHELATWISDSITAALSRLKTMLHQDAPWRGDDTPNEELSAAVEVFLHSLTPRTEVRPVKSQTDSAGRTLRRDQFQIDLAIAAPTQISALAPILALMGDASQRNYIIEHVVRPITMSVFTALGFSDVVSPYIDVGVNTASVLYDLFEHYVMAPSGSSSPEKQTPTSYAGKGAESELYTILHSLAVFHTEVQATVAIPLPTSNDGTMTGTTEPAHVAQSWAFSFLRGLLRNVMVPTPLAVPPASDPSVVDVVVHLVRAPTTFLEILNNTFSSTQRLSSEMRTSAIDAVMSPKAKINIGLKLYSELVVEVFRPYALFSGTVLADENGKGGKPKAPPCVPIVDLPKNVVASNAAVNEAATKLMQSLDGVEKKLATSLEMPLIGKGKALVVRLTESVLADDSARVLTDKWAALQLEVTEWSSVQVDTLLPFGMSVHERAEASRPLLYVRTVLQRHALNG